MVYHRTSDKILGCIVILLVITLMFTAVMIAKASHDSNELQISGVSVDLSENILDDDKVTISSISFEREESKVFNFMMRDPKLNFKTKKDYQAIGLDILLSDDSYTFYKKDAEKIVNLIESNYIGEVYADVYSK